MWAETDTGCKWGIMLRGSQGEEECLCSKEAQAGPTSVGHKALMNSRHVLGITRAGAAGQADGGTSLHEDDPLFSFPRDHRGTKSYSSPIHVPHATC